MSNPLTAPASDPDALRASLNLLIDNLAPGGELVYFVGHLAAARVRGVPRTTGLSTVEVDENGALVFDWVPVEPYHTIAETFEAAAADGRVFLFQSREDGGAMRYVARKRVPVGTHDARAALEARRSAAGRVS